MTFIITNYHNLCKIYHFGSEGLHHYMLMNQGCASARKFVNICEFVSGICEFDLEKLIHRGVNIA